MSSSPGTPASDPEPDRSTYRPVLFRPALSDDARRLADAKASSPGLQVLDRLEIQLRELIKVLNPSRTFTTEDLVSEAMGHLGGTDPDDYGVWVHYPWSHRLVHLLDEEEFALVRTDRNRNKITHEEQQRLSHKKVGIVGLSVGRSVAMAMALERTFGELRLADHDQLDLSNLNRIRAGVHELGLNKCIATAREIAELDPFLRVTCFTDGLKASNIDEFLTSGGRLDMLVEECDSVDIKIIVRQKAKALRIPVLMDTSDRGMIDVERFDREPDRSILHGLIDHLDPAEAARAKTNEDKIPFLAPIAGMDQLSPRMKASMVEIGQTITTWPQLATGVILGGALVGDAYRRIALGEFQASGRWYVDLERLIADEALEPVHAPSIAPAPSNGTFGTSSGPLADQLRSAERIGSNGKGFTADQARVLAEAGAMAPSADNMQPWTILHHRGALHLFHDRSRSGSALDKEEMIPQVALGMCLENMLIRAKAMGLYPTCDLFPVEDDATLVAVVRPGDARSGAVDGGDIALARQIAARHTDRKHGDGSPLPKGIVDQLDQAVARIPGARLHVLTDRGSIEAIAKICGAADRLRIMNEHGHEEFFNKQLRWTHEEAVHAGDGLDIETLELTASERVGLRMAASPLAMSAIRGIGGGKALEKISAKAVRATSAVALLTVPAVNRRHCLDGGRAAERLWLKATELGVSVHPLSAPVLLAWPAQRTDDPSLTAAERGEVLALRDALRAIFDLSEGEPLFMTGLTRTTGAVIRSVRRPLDAVFHRTERP